jgi:S-adenosylmethionine synthetase
MGARHLFTSESVTEGHPDKIADQISDSVLDALLMQDKMSRVACEVLVTTGLAFVAGEITSRGYVEIPSLVRRVIGEIGYDEKFGARPLGRVIQEHIKKPLAEEVLFGKLAHGGTVRILLKDDALTFQYLGREEERALPKPPDRKALPGKPKKSRTKTT